MFDVLVIGGGLAGATAALAAKQEGATVALAARSWGATAMSTGALDIAFTPALSAEHQMPRTVAEHVMDIVAHRKRHPYAVIGLERALFGIQAGYALWEGSLADSDLALAPLDLEAQNIALASTLGTVIPAATAFLPHRGLDFGRRVEGRWGILQLFGDPHFDGHRIRLGLEHDASLWTGDRPQLFEIPLTVRAAPPMALARFFDDQENVDQVAREMAKKVRGFDGILAPPVLGLERHGEARARLAQAAGAPVVEALAHLPSVPGVRLQRAVESALREAGVEPVGEVVSAKTAGGRVEHVVTGDHLEIGVGSVVLATGRFITGGIRWQERCAEGLFGLPVVSEVGLLEDDSPHPVVRELPTESHPLMTAGVGVNEELQPMREGQVAFTNLFAAGNVLGGFASRYALCSDGVALATGWLAGKAAVKR